MRIGLNATCLNGRPSGANQRFRRLYGAVIRRNPELDFVVYEPADYPVATWFADAPNVSARRTPLPSTGRVARLRAGLGYWRRALAADAIDLFESFHLPLAAAPCPRLLTVHDLSADASLLERLATRVALAHAFARADRVIAVSDAMRAEILAFRPGTAVSTVHNGVDARGFGTVDAAAHAEARRRWALPEDFALTVGHLKRRKNVALLIDAVAVLRARGLARPLAVVGRGGEAKALRARIADRGLADLVTLIEDADDDAVRALYAGCRLVAIPSVYEGFGIPLIEAMAARRPLVTSDIAVFREITGGEGSYFPVDDVPAAAAAIERAWSDPAERMRLTANGDNRVGLFAFDRLADKVAALYADVAIPSAAAIRPRAASNE